MNNFRRGEITSAQLVALIMAIVGFIVVLFLLFSLEFESYSEDEVCKLSVLSRATSPSATAGYIPLQCTTGKICITDDKKNKCNQFLGEEKVNYVIVNTKKPDEAARIIEKTVADAMYYCWQMMGEGKLDLFNKGLAKSLGFQFTEDKPTCIICSRVAISEGVFKNNEVGRLIDINYYMIRNKAPNSDLTYAEKLTSKGVRSYLDAGQQVSGQQNNKGTNQLGVVFMQLSTPKSFTEQLKSSLSSGFIFAGSAFLTPTGKVITSTWGAGLTLLSIGVTSGLSAYNARQSQLISAGYCGKFTSSAEEAMEGCSILKVFDYSDIKKINDFCAVIEGNP